MRRLRKQLAVLSAVVALALCCAHARADDASYLRLKAAYLVNIARFVSWPSDDEKVVRLCLPSASDLAPLSATLDGQPVGNERTLRVVEPLGACDLLYLDKFSARAERFEAFGDSGKTLVVAEIADARQRGFAIQMYTRDLKLRLAINEDIVQDADYEMSSKLLRLYRRLN